MWRAVATKFRKKRFQFFQALIANLPRPITILDVGGTARFWETVGYIKDDTNILLFNTKAFPAKYANMTSVAGDATAMPEYRDKEFSIVFSNSVIEHLGSFEDQQKMAEEIRRVGQRYYVQTPNRYFPIEPHVLIPFFQFYPLRLKIFIVTHFKTPWGWEIPDKARATRHISSIRLMSERELRQLFPGAKIYREKFMGLTKSITADDGW
jgi:hypothetical protein